MKSLPIIGEFRSGDRVPSWLYDVEPSGRNSRPCRLIFACDCAVVEFRGAYWILPHRFDRAPVKAIGGQNAAILATGQDVVTPIRFQTMHVTAPGEAQNR